MLLSSSLAKYYIVALITVTPPTMPEQGWVQMLHPFDTREACKIELNEKEYLYFANLMQTLKGVILRIEMMECMSGSNVEKLNKELGHSMSKRIGV